MSGATNSVTGQYIIYFVLYNLCNLKHLCLTAGFRNCVHEICSLLLLYAAYNDSSLPTFRDKLSVI